MKYCNLIGLQYFAAEQIQGLPKFMDLPQPCTRLSHPRLIHWTATRAESKVDQPESPSPPPPQTLSGAAANLRISTYVHMVAMHLYSIVFLYDWCKLQYLILVSPLYFSCSPSLATRIATLIWQLSPSYQEFRSQIAMHFVSTFFMHGLSWYS